jgi:hypothetical protein
MTTAPFTYWAEPYLSEAGYGIRIRCGNPDGAYMTSPYGIDLNGAYGLVPSRKEAGAIAQLLNVAILRHRGHGGSMEDAMADLGATILRGYYRNEVMYDAHRNLQNGGRWPL